MIVHHIETYSAKRAVHITREQGIASNLPEACVVLNVIRSNCRAVIGSRISGKVEGVGANFHMQSLVVYELEIEVRENVQVRQRNNLLVAR